MMFNRQHEKDTLFRQPEQPKFHGPRAATVDAAAAREKPALKNMLGGVPGMFNRTTVSPKEESIYAAGLQSFLAGDREGAVLQWRQIPSHPEARRAMQRIFDQVNEEGRQ